jgi:uncharacterized lipoprotein
MKHALRSFHALLGVAAISLMSACATQGSNTAASSATTGTTSASAGADENVAMTGSRLPRKSTDRMIRQTGAAGAKEIERDRPPSPGPAVQ